ncbi:MAG TPA: iron-containing alcohol dehydrogenase [Ferrovibrio sp.]|jgi:alcohol dehydrogenase class IV|uniref:iron-containing alcohol dehydrogenase n=1 Tax=Ferrovibrio sp. TaxID=1917215 RepID=UPI002B4B932B|nr:iron-containing alcohol dehydrogenase [Ferrovibrio sp.]HLT77014.1 iron-containing alcohol dehydrogenase [Ferrovibrio sp.]
MTTLSFETTRRVYCEPGASTKLGGLLAELGVTRAILVTDPGVMKLGLPKAALESLEAAGIAVAIYDRTEADPPEKLVHEAVEAARQHRADGVVGFGGGSSMDIAKLVAFLPVASQQLSEIYGVGFCKGRRLPLVQVPTTAGTGSEVTGIAIITTGESEKKGVVSPMLLPDIALLDADLTLGLPRHVTAATGVDAMVHAIEAYTSKHKKNPISDALAREALSLLSRNIRRVCSEEGARDRQARSEMLLGAMLAGMAFANAPVAAVHALAYPVGGHFHVPHGLSNALMLPHVLRFNLENETAARQYGELAPVLLPGSSFGSTNAAAGALLAELEAIIDDVKLEKQLRQVGISHNHLPMLAKDAMNQQRLLVNNPREVTYDDALKIYEQAL